MSGMNCREFERPLMDRARNRPMDAAERTALAVHLELCPRCSKALERQIRLSAAMETLAERTAEVSAPLSVDQAVLAELSAVRGHARRRWIYSGAGVALAASLAMVWWLGSAPAPKTSEAHATPAPPAAVAETATQEPVKTASAVPAVKRVPKRRVQPAAKPEEPFVAIPYTLPLEPYERASVVRMDLPVTALIAAGLPVGAADPTGQVRTDVLVGQDGRARAVRLVTVAKSN